MKESKPQLMAATDTAAARGHEGKTQPEAVAEPFGTFVALKRLTQLDIEAVRMQGCADGAGACIEASGNR